MVCNVTKMEDDKWCTSGSPFQFWRARWRVFFDLMESAVWQVEIRVSPVGHGPVEYPVEAVDVHVEVLGGLDDPVDVPLAGPPLGWKVVKVERPLVKQDGVELVHAVQVGPVGSGQAPRFRAQVFEEGVAARTDVVVLGTVSQVPHQDRLQLGLGSVIVPADAKRSRNDRVFLNTFHTLITI